MDREAWRAVVQGVAKSQIWLSDWTELNWWLFWSFIHPLTFLISSLLCFLSLKPSNTFKGFLQNTGFYLKSGLQVNFCQGSCSQAPLLERACLTLWGTQQGALVKRPTSGPTESWVPAGWPPSSKFLEVAIYLEKYLMWLFSESILYMLSFFYLVLYRQILHGYQKNNLYTYFFHYCNFLKKHYNILVHRSIQPMYFHEVCKTVHWVNRRLHLILTWNALYLMTVYGQEVSKPSVFKRYNIKACHNKSGGSAPHGGAGQPVWRSVS